MNSVILDIYKDSLEYSAKDLKTLLILGVTYFIDFGSNILFKFPFASNILDLRLFLQSYKNLCRGYDQW